MNAPPAVRTASAPLLSTLAFTIATIPPAARAWVLFAPENTIGTWIQGTWGDHLPVELPLRVTDDRWVSPHIDPVALILTGFIAAAMAGAIVTFEVRAPGLLNGPLKAIRALAVTVSAQLAWLSALGAAAPGLLYRDGGSSGPCSTKRKLPAEPTCRARGRP